MSEGNPRTEPFVDVSRSEVAFHTRLERRTVADSRELFFRADRTVLRVEVDSDDSEPVIRQALAGEPAEIYAPPNDSASIV